MKTKFTRIMEGTAIRSLEKYPSGHRRGTQRESARYIDRTMLILTQGRVSTEQVLIAKK